MLLRRLVCSKSTRIRGFRPLSSLGTPEFDLAACNAILHTAFTAPDSSAFVSQLIELGYGDPRERNPVLLLSSICNSLLIHHRSGAIEDHISTLSRPFEQLLHSLLIERLEIHAAVLMLEHILPLNLQLSDLGLCLQFCKTLHSALPQPQPPTNFPVDLFPTFLLHHYAQQPSTRTIFNFLDQVLPSPSTVAPTSSISIALSHHPELLPPLFSQFFQSLRSQRLTDSLNFHKFISRLAHTSTLHNSPISIDTLSHILTDPHLSHNAALLTWSLPSLNLTLQISASTAENITTIFNALQHTHPRHRYSHQLIAALLNRLVMIMKDGACSSCVCFSNFSVFLFLSYRNRLTKHPPIRLGSRTPMPSIRLDSVVSALSFTNSTYSNNVISIYSL